MADPSAGPLIALYYASAGALFLASLHGAILATSTPYVRSNWCYVAAGIGVALYQIFCALEYAAPTVEQAIWAHKLGMLSATAVLPVFLAGLTYLRPTRRLIQLIGLSLGIALFLAFENFRLPYGMNFADLQGMRIVSLPWDER